MKDKGIKLKCVRMKLTNDKKEILSKSVGLEIQNIRCPMASNVISVAQSGMHVCL